MIAYETAHRIAQRSMLNVVGVGELCPLFSGPWDAAFTHITGIILGAPTNQVQNMTGHCRHRCRRCRHLCGPIESIAAYCAINRVFREAPRPHWSVLLLPLFLLSQDPVVATEHPTNTDTAETNDATRRWTELTSLNILYNRRWTFSVFEAALLHSCAKARI